MKFLFVSSGNTTVDELMMRLMGAMEIFTAQQQEDIKDEVGLDPSKKTLFLINSDVFIVQDTTFGVILCNVCWNFKPFFSDHHINNKALFQVIFLTMLSLHEMFV